MINGHDSVDLGARELQYACTFPLATPKLCSEAVFEGDGNCMCFKADASYNRAICQPPGGGAAGITQYGSGATPGIRQLQLLQSLGDSAVVASACPKVVDAAAAAADYGYRPAMDALAARIESALAP